MSFQFNSLSSWAAYLHTFIYEYAKMYWMSPPFGWFFSLISEQKRLFPLLQYAATKWI